MKNQDGQRSLCEQAVLAKYTALRSEAVSLTQGGVYLKNQDGQCSLHEQAVLAEYTALRSEAASLTQGETSLIATTFSFIAAILGLNFLFGSNANLTAIKFMVIGICPFAAMFFGILWMNTFYRRVRIGAYLFLMEKDINYGATADHQKIYWEHWIVIQAAQHSLFTKVSQFYGYIAFGSWLSSPLLVFGCAHFLFPDWKLLEPPWELMNWYFAHPWVGLFFFAVLLIYIYIMIGLCVEILNLKNLEKLQQQVRSANPKQSKVEKKTRTKKPMRDNRKK